MNRDLSGVSEWQELIGDRPGWRDATSQPAPPAVTYRSRPTSSRTWRQEEDEVCVCVCVSVCQCVCTFVLVHDTHLTHLPLLSFAEIPDILNCLACGG